MPVLGLSIIADAQPAPDYGFDFVAIGSPGNRGVTPEEAPGLFPPLQDPALPLGRVDYEFRMMRTEVTAVQWAEFVNAYFPYWGGSAFSPELTGRWVAYFSNEPGNMFRAVPTAENFPSNSSWATALRFCNWLTNDKRGDAAAFETGAYDMSMLVDNMDGTWQVPTRQATARFWMPTLDEWTKAMYYDPDKNGPGVEGYWQYPTTSDVPPISGYPWEGGQTSGGIPLVGPPFVFLDVGSYPQVQSPWGLLDGSGSRTEWCETTFLGTPSARGSAEFFGNWERTDRLDVLQGAGAPVQFSFGGLRLATTIPGPSSILSVIVVGCFVNRRRKCEQC